MNLEKLISAGVGLSLVAISVALAVPTCRWLERSNAASDRARFGAVEAQIRGQLLRHHGMTSTATCTDGSGSYWYHCVARTPAGVQYFQCPPHTAELCMPVIGGVR